MRQNRENFADKAAFATFMQPLQYDLRLSAAKYNSITHAAGAARNLNRGIPLRPANTESKNTMELRTTATQIAAPKPHLDAKAEKRRF